VAKSRYNNSNRNYYLKIVLDIFKTTKWRDFLGLNINETMNLDHSNFMSLKDFVSEYSKLENEVSDKYLDDIKKERELNKKKFNIKGE
jgi:hypothetical protein